ncbi:MAG: DUF6489 family protein [Alphaproteobacteria bacterium]|jgi:hypothetical protein|nr:hypothetical protein [Rhodospirillaceae bacterium]MBT6206122.1 hypothetical protein [Rhodospirillaceae bacterium]MBT6509101.1 hypothetical protein [Rhodospirillaceae bacterium]MBT7649080.1 hypothetical protein [Rhodospirillaceae bacterium]MDG2482614.1 DUF6489 family protein [Alphaproteobacteria bacterium]
MKVTIEIDCTPEEARSLLGMPDVKPLQDEIMADLRARMTEAAGAFDTDATLKSWMGASGDGMDQMMKFWSKMADPTGKDGA